MGDQTNHLSCFQYHGAITKEQGFKYWLSSCNTSCISGLESSGQEAAKDLYWPTFQDITLYILYSCEIHTEQTLNCTKYPPFCSRVLSETTWLKDDLNYLKTSLKI